jgi:hypothetical protein
LGKIVEGGKIKNEKRYFKISSLLVGSMQRNYLGKLIGRWIPEDSSKLSECKVFFSAL